MEPRSRSRGCRNVSWKLGCGSRSEEGGRKGRCESEEDYLQQQQQQVNRGGTGLEKEEDYGAWILSRCLLLLFMVEIVTVICWFCLLLIIFLNRIGNDRVFCFTYGRKVRELQLLLLRGMIDR